LTIDCPAQQVGVCEKADPKKAADGGIVNQLLCPSSAKLLGPIGLREGAKIASKEETVDECGTASTRVPHPKYDVLFVSPIWILLLAPFQLLPHLLFLYVSLHCFERRYQNIFSCTMPHTPV
jgi:hypothetical protein